MEISNADRFLNAYAIIENRLRKILRSRRHVGFVGMVEDARRRNSIVHRFRDDLKEFAVLRNAIVHDRADDVHVIAEPHLWAVKRIERIAELLEIPPKVMPLFKRAVIKLRVEDPIANCVREMYKRDISKLPVYDVSSFFGVITARCIARWLGACVHDEIFSTRETAISEVMHFSEDRDNFRFIGRSATLFEAVHEFKKFANQGKRLEALLITHNGRESEKLLGIMTIRDVPAALKEIALNEGRE